MRGSSWHGAARVSDASLCSLPCPSTLPDALVARGAVRGTRLVWWHAKEAVVCEGRVARSLRAGRRARRESGRPSVVLLECVRVWWGSERGAETGALNPQPFRGHQSIWAMASLPPPPGSSRMRTLRHADAEACARFLSRAAGAYVRSLHGTAHAPRVPLSSLPRPPP